MKNSVKWILLNLVLLLGYLGFFHLAKLVGFPNSAILGVLVSHTMFGLCYWSREQFVNRLELGLYLVLPLDVALESLVPYHEGYSFYGCAAGFWLVFLGYRSYALWRLSTSSLNRQKTDELFTPIATKN